MGGMELLVDGVRTADADNPRGYYEYEPVKTLQENAQWLDVAEGKAVKIVSHLLFHLPDSNSYKILFMKRDLREVIASQNEMLRRRQKSKSSVNDQKLSEIFQKHLYAITAWLTKQQKIDVLYLQYHDILEQPLENAYEIQHFLREVNPLDAENMANVVDRALYRQRKPS